MRANILTLTFIGVIGGCNPQAKQAVSDKNPECLLADYILPPFGNSQVEVPKGGYDESDDLYDLRIHVPGDVIAREIPGFKDELNDKYSELQQFLYLTFATPKEPIRSPDAEVTPIQEHEALFKLAGDTEYDWSLVEKDEGGDKLWGSCMESALGGFHCMTSLSFEDFSINYELHQANLPLYDKVESYLRRQVSVCELSP